MVSVIVFGVVVFRRVRDCEALGFVWVVVMSSIINNMKDVNPSGKEDTLRERIKVVNNVCHSYSLVDS